MTEPAQHPFDERLSLEVRTLAVDRGSRRVLENLNFTLAPGQLVLLKGPNGTGKTTLIRTLAGLLPEAEGHIRFGGSVLADDRRAFIHYVGHATALKPVQTVAETLVFWARYFGGDPQPARIDAAMDTLSLLPLWDSPCRYLSSGQRRRLALARLLVADRPLWLLDEPTVGLDAASVIQLEGLISKHLDRGGMALIATHLPINLTADEIVLKSAQSAMKAA